MGTNDSPPFQITLKILQLSSSIQGILGELKNTEIIKPSVKLRKQNQIQTIHHSLAIEGNTLTLDQVTAIIENKKVIGPKKELTEVKNALAVYETLGELKPTSEKDFFKAHKILMKDLIFEAGVYRKTNVGILKGTQVSHVAPQAKLVPVLMNDLFSFLKNKTEISYLIKACVFHYELEFIHPFADGNGRMGRLWQQLILMKHSAVFEYLSVESLIHKNQSQYYKTLETCDKAGESTAFIEFSLGLIFKALQNFKEEFRPKKLGVTDRLAVAHNQFVQNLFSRKQYMGLFSEISTATASRDLNFGKENHILVVQNKA
ncbi:MAG: Fic family protein, partial [Moraxellaceae bacterium]|nr:Fic family protein [Pseudobdellovibrionaceae bacterium]